MAKRKSKEVVPVNITRQEAESAFAEYAEANAKKQKITAEMDEKITRIREKYSAEILELMKTEEKAFERIQTYAQNNPEDFKNKKSIDCVHGTFGFRTGTPKLVLLKGFKWESALKLVKALLPAYIRTEEEVAKDKLLADRFKPEVANKLADCGITVGKAELFYVEPKKEQVEAAA